MTLISNFHVAKDLVDFAVQFRDFLYVTGQLDFSMFAHGCVLALERSGWGQCQVSIIMCAEVSLLACPKTYMKPTLQARHVRCLKFLSGVL